MSAYRARAVVDLAAISANIKLIQSTCSVPVMAVVKADAYGHGLIPVAKAAISAGATWLGVALPEEAIALRKAGITAPILAWLASPGAPFNELIAHDIDIAIPSIAIFTEVLAAANALKKKAHIHIEVDTGMSRGGFRDEWNTFLERSDLRDVEVIGIFSHFARADEADSDFNLQQKKRFAEMVTELGARGISPQIQHLANSAAALQDQDARMGMVRIGIAMYGLSPDYERMGSSKSLKLQPAMCLEARLHLVKEVEAGSSVGYGSGAQTTRKTKLGVVAMGYADGIPRMAKNAGIFIDGKRAPLIGRVSMDQFVVDLGPDSTVKGGEWVCIFGNGNSGEYTADDWAAAVSSINYEIVTRIGPRVPRIYK